MYRVVVDFFSLIRHSTILKFGNGKNRDLVPQKINFLVDEYDWQSKSYVKIIQENRGSMPSLSFYYNWSILTGYMQSYKRPFFFKVRFLGRETS